MSELIYSSTGLLISGRVPMSTNPFEDLLPLETCNLVPLDFVHSLDVVRWRNDPANALWFTTSHKFTVEGHEAWLVKARASKTDFNWMIEDKAGEPIGTIGLYNLDRSAGRVEIGRILIGNNKNRRGGYARAAIAALLQLCRISGISVVYLYVLPGNKKAIQLYRSLDFKVTESRLTTVRMEHLITSIL
jgi:RimJ/RimL family protein N-acetyltransferase